MRHPRAPRLDLVETLHGHRVANLCGGNEEGEAWHRAGMRERKQHVFDDFAAVARHLVVRGWTRPERLAVSGGSNGGLLVGATLTQHPELARAAVCSGRPPRAARSCSAASATPATARARSAARSRSMPTRSRSSPTSSAWTRRPRRC